MPKPIVTSGQITAQVSSECQFLAERRSAKISEDHQLDTCNRGELQQILSLCLATISTSFETLIFIDSSQRFINDRAGFREICHRYGLIMLKEKREGRLRWRRSWRLVSSATRDAANRHQSVSINVVSGSLSCPVCLSVSVWVSVSTEDRRHANSCLD